MCPRSLGWVHRCCQDCNMSVDLEFTAKGRGSATHIKVFSKFNSSNSMFTFMGIFMAFAWNSSQAQYSWSFGQTAPGSRQPFSQSSLYLQHLNGWTLGTLMQQWCTKSFYKINCLHYFIEKLRRRRLKKAYHCKEIFSIQRKHGVTFDNWLCFSTELWSKHLNINNFARL